MTMRFGVELIFWLGVLALFYTFAGYPFLLFVISHLRPARVRRAQITPAVTLIITAYNEERDLAAKLENTLALDYPRNLLEIIVASDCSSDRTDEIARTFADRGVRLLRQPERLGKVAAQNAAVAQARGEVILFSDATTMYKPDVVRAIVPGFADQRVGCVGGRLVYVDGSDSSIGQGARSYWSYESHLRKYESRIWSLIGTAGCLYAVRRSAYVPLYHEAGSDFVISLEMIKQGLRTIYEPDAVCTEETNRKVDAEMKMRVRLIAHTFADLWHYRAMLNPFRYGFFAVQLLSHKLMRYFVPFFLMALLGATATLAPDSFFYRTLLIAQIAGYTLAIAAWLLSRLGMRVRLLAIPQYFLLANIASLIACYRFLRGERFARWEPIREPAVQTVAQHESP